MTLSKLTKISRFLGKLKEKKKIVHPNIDEVKQDSSRQFSKILRKNVTVPQNSPLFVTLNDILKIDNNHNIIEKK